MQHGFQKYKNVLDVALMTTLLLDRARERHGKLYILSKDCEKCFGRITRWVMTYIYQRTGVPPILYNILVGF
ncbi:hypothetical protein JG688_00003002 [Phytophthora aleatoria]|uniref:Reverse transcriptase domain-containing protein n=1 Tax=Phytophthora aleatoria TaxID=2496075 RepID=A0A8J5ITV3_9STRA|nr:hypothetical protein JG688_00003002 [Phytophthora aleatoria]